MPARDQQQQIGEAELRIGQHRRERMAFQVIDGDQRLAGRERQALGGDQPDHDAADQPGAGGRGDRVDLGQLDARLGKRAGDEIGQDFDMGPRGDLRHHAAERPVRGFLAGQPMRQDASIGGDQADRRLIAGGFDTKNQTHSASLHRLQGLGQGLHDPPRPYRHARLPLGAHPGPDGGRSAARRPWLGPGVDRDRADHDDGRRDPGPPLSEVGGKGLWTKELDRALGDGRTDISVHSMKDVETVRPAEFVIEAMLPRADVRDRLIGAETIEGLPHWAKVGTSSPRRAAQLLARRPDLNIVAFRGNVATRLRRLEMGEADATLLAAAGLERLGQSEIGTALEDMLPAPAQGAVGVEVLAANARVRALVQAIDDRPTHLCVSAERRLLEALGGSCRSPIAALATAEEARSCCARKS
jgi:hydroxymethylbilane synthase